MTIKTQGGKVITKDGKVSCSCCEEPEGCCMYPAQALVDGLYTVDDLPDEIFVISSYGNVVLPVDRSGPVGDRGIKYYYGDIGGEEVSVSLNTDGDEAIWKGSAEVDTIGGCLISKLEIDDPGGPILDQFADTYTITYLPNPLPGQQSISVTVSRTSLCIWEGLDGCGRPWYLIYGDSIFGAGSPVTWKVVMAIDENPLDDPCGDFQQQPQSKNSNEFNNTPIGNYTEGDYPATVS